MKWITLILLSLLALAPQTCAETIRISAAASLTEVVTDLIGAFETQGGSIKAVTNFGSSGNLAKQISHGAPTDIFVSANLKWVEYLADQNLLVESSPRILAYNSLVFIGPENSPADSLQGLTGLGRIAIGSPANVPAGIYARQALENGGIYQTLQKAKKLVLAKDVRQAMLYAEMGEVDGAFVYRTDALLARNSRILFEVPADLHDRVCVLIALAGSARNRRSAQSFYNFMVSDAAAALFTAYGFTPGP